MQCSPELDRVYELGLTSMGTDLLDGDQLIKLSSMAHARKALVHTVEAYIVDGEDEILSLEHSVFGPGEESDRSNWARQVSQALESVKDVVEAASSNALPVRFKVWLAETP